MNNIIPVVFSFDKRIVLGASVAIKSLIDCAKDSTTYDIRVFHSDLDIKNQKNISKLADNSRHNISFHYINPELFIKAPHNNKSWTELVYYRLLTPEILKEYDKAIYADVDVLFKGDLSEVYNTDLEDYDCAAVAMEPNNENVIGHNYFPENKKDLIYISSFILFNCKLMREKGFVQKVYDVIKTFNNRLKFFDLDTLNLACDKIKELPYRYGVFQSLYYNNDIKTAKEYEFLSKIYSDEVLEEEKKNTIMLHYAGKLGKPWRMKNTYSDYQKYINELPKELKQMTLRDIRKKFFNKV